MSTPATAPLSGDAGRGPSVARTLPLRVEAIRQFRRRRTLVVFGVGGALPWLLLAAFLIGDEPSPGATPTLVDVATTSGLNFALFTQFIVAGLPTVAAVALFCGDTVAAEANWSSLRYLLAVPVPRARLLRQKLIVALGYSALIIVTVPLMAVLAGTLAYGWGEVRLPGGGPALPAEDVAGRMLLIVGYALVSQLMVAALAFLLSVSTDSPLGAVGGTVGLVIVSIILNAVTALGAWRGLLPAHWVFAWMDALQPSIHWTGMVEGAAVSLSYAVVLLAFAFYRFRAKDIVS
jgi:ABC-type transport system involved in multi-copper enzyme maturation permease subunit